MSQHRDNEVGLGIALLLQSANCDLSSLSRELLEQPFLQQVGIRRRRPGWQG